MFWENLRDCSFWARLCFKKQFFKEHPLSVFCELRIGHTPIRYTGSKWTISRDEYPEDTWPPHCNGPLYMFSAEANRQLLANTRNARFLRFDDILYPGVIGTNITIHHYEAAAMSEVSVLKTITQTDFEPNHLFFSQF